MLKIVSPLCAFSLYLCWLFEGGIGRFGSMHNQIVATLLITMIFSSLAGIVSTKRYNRQEIGDNIDENAFTYNIMLWIALLSALPYFKDRHHVDILVAVGVVAAASSLLTKKRFISTATKLLIDGTCVLSAGIHFRLVSIDRFAFGRNSDMLVLVKKALTSFMSGENPYQFHIMDQTKQIYQLPLTYLPAKWLAYLPAHLLSADLRITNIIAEALIFVLLAVLLLRTSRTRSTAPLLGMGSLYVYFLNGYFMHRVDTEIPVYCLIITIVFLLFVKGWNRLGYIALGIGLAASQLTLLLIPFIAWRTFKTHGVKTTALLIGLMLFTAAAILVPFIIPDPASFKAGLVDHWASVAKNDYEWAIRNIVNLNLSPHFFKHNNQWLLQYIQASLCAVIFAIYTWRKAYMTNAGVWSFCALTTFIFLLFNIITWTYLFQPVLLMATLSICALENMSGRENVAK